MDGFQYAPINDLIQRAGEVVVSYFGQNLEITDKGMASNFCTQADLESERVILRGLAELYPDYNLVSEESGRIDTGSEYTFLIDPLDGTNNFALGIDNFTLSIGLMKGEEIIAGIVYQPILKRLFTAERGRGAYLNGEKITVSPERNIKSSTIAWSQGYAVPHRQWQAARAYFSHQSIKRVLESWSPAYDLCLVASGKIEGMVALDIDPHDFCAGKLIAREAGAMITDLQGNPNPDSDVRFMVSCCSEIRELLVASFR
ncbi:inositol monophosphatase [Patescibacteria group bacterium]|nr:inositol monophosphatase [Patescibacteria group bacterium]